MAQEMKFLCNPPSLTIDDPTYTDRFTSTNSNFSKRHIQTSLAAHFEALDSNHSTDSSQNESVGKLQLLIVLWLLIHCTLLVLIDFCPV